VTAPFLSGAGDRDGTIAVHAKGVNGDAQGHHTRDNRGAERVASKANFLLVSHRQDGDFLIVNPIANDVAAIAECDQSISILVGQAFDGAPYAWMFPHQYGALADCFDGAFRGVRTLWGKKSVKALNIDQRAARPN
jgi:hypothetical protein